MKNNFGRKNRSIQLLLIDTAFFIAVYALFACLSIFSSSAVVLGALDYVYNGLILLLSVTVSRLAFRVYVRVWRYATYSGYIRLVFSDFIGGCVGLLATYFAGFDLYIGIWQTIGVISVSSLSCISARMLYQFMRGIGILHTQKGFRYIAIVGAGSVGVSLAAELLGKTGSEYRPWCFIDNDPAKIGRIINDLKVYDGDPDRIMDVLKSSPVEEVVIAMSDSRSETISKLYYDYSEAGFKVRIYGFASGSPNEADGGSRRLRDIQIEDLLFRPLCEIPEVDIGHYRKKTVLVTGGGGSIGSEICRQIAQLDPEKIVVFDMYENGAYELQQELRMQYGDKLDLAVEIGSVRDRKRIEEVFSIYRPHVVFHAAAHKHVPLMEDSAGETVKNNVIGTYNAADMAEKYGAEKFVLISTDKAVNPTNVMGASKRMCEMIVQSRRDSRTSFAAVRFGNVLGSNGSVIPLFKKQIASGGPVTITDKRIIRYFMTIYEASRLVISAGAYATRGELFVLDMGSPVSILKLAENMIRLSGLVPYKDIDIREIGLRPGEKLYEELLIKSENQSKTANSLIFVEKDAPLSRREVDEKIAVLVKALEEYGSSSEKIREAYKKVIPTFVDPEQANDAAANFDGFKASAAVSSDDRA